MTTTTTRTVIDRLMGIQRQLRALGRDPGEWDPMDFAYLSTLHDDIDRIRAMIVEGLRESGITDKQIGEALGITQQAVSKKWPGGGRFVGAAGRYRSTQPATTEEP